MIENMGVKEACEIVNLARKRPDYKADSLGTDEWLYLTSEGRIMASCRIGQNIDPELDYLADLVRAVNYLLDHGLITLPD